MQPTIFWWNLTRLGEALGELFGAGDSVDAFWGRKDFIDGSIEDSEVDPILREAEKIIGEVAEEYKETFIQSYKDTMSKRFGFKIKTEEDFGLISEALGLMEAHELDFSHFFYRLSEKEFSGEHIVQGLQGNFGGMGREKAVEEIDAYLAKYRAKLQEDHIALDDERSRAMKKANPSFVLRSWILDEAIQKVEKEGDRTLLPELVKMITSPFEDWASISENGARFCGPVPSGTISGANTQCSCSS